jgi:hypothetical protein
MMMKKFLLLTLFFGSISVIMSSCSKDDDKNEPIVAVTNTILTDASFMGSYDYFSFEQNKQVDRSEAGTTNWDFGMLFINMVVNSGSRGPGNAGVQILTTAFDELSEAPETGYVAEGSASEPAVKTEDWGVYNPVQRSFTPIAGKVFVFRTAKGNYAKMEMLKAEPTNDNGEVVVPPTVPTKIKYTFRYAYQPNGSRKF